MLALNEPRVQIAKDLGISKATLYKELRVLYQHSQQNNKSKTENFQNYKK